MKCFLLILYLPVQFFRFCFTNWFASFAILCRYGYMHGEVDFGEATPDNGIARSWESNPICNIQYRHFLIKSHSNNAPELKCESSFAPNLPANGTSDTNVFTVRRISRVKNGHRAWATQSGRGRSRNNRSKAAIARSKNICRAVGTEATIDTRTTKPPWKWSRVISAHQGVLPKEA
jgi:hypothetical protein